MSLNPFFASELDAGTYWIRVVIGGVGTNVSVTVPERTYWSPAALTGGKSSIAHLVVAALNGAGTGSTWAVSPGAASLRTGLAMSIDKTAAAAWTLNYTSASTADDGRLDLRWLGLTNANKTTGSDGKLHITRQPLGTWFPKVAFNLEASVPDVPAIFTSSVSADGSTFSVDQTDGTIIRWLPFRSLEGALRARIDVQALNDAWADWATQAVGVAGGSLEEWISLNGAESWWSRTRGGRLRFIYWRDEEDATSLWPRELRISYAPTCPMNMVDWRGLRNLTAGPTMGGRIFVSFAALQE